MQQIQDSFFVDMKSSDPLLDLPTHLEYYLQCLKVEIRIRTKLVGHLLKVRTYHWIPQWKCTVKLS